MGLRKSQGLAPLSPRKSQGHVSNDGLPNLNNGTKQEITQIPLGSRTESNPGIWIPPGEEMRHSTEYYLS